MQLLSWLLWLRLAAAELELYWNVPTFMCQKYRLDFAPAARRFGFAQNRGDTFAGERLAILYDPGAFPALLSADEATTLLVRNGGVPQEGELARHLRLFGEQLERMLPAADEFAGLGVIDMESWRPVFRQNWAALQVYRNYSLELERRRHPRWTAARQRDEAQRRFERAAREFMLATLRMAKRLRPRARWGYYAYPYCFNWSPAQQSSQCAAQVQRENDEMRWLFDESSVLYPSVYLQRKLSPEQRLGVVRGRVQEAVRLAANSSAKVLVYYWFKYQDQRDTYLEQREIESTVAEIAVRGADGLVLWGSSSDFDSRAKCEAFADYLDHSLGPAIERARHRRRRGTTL